MTGDVSNTGDGCVCVCLSADAAVEHWCEERANAEREDWCYGDNEDLESDAKPFRTSHSQLINHPLDSRTHTHVHALATALLGPCVATGH